MTKEWQFQVRVDLPEAPAEVARRDPADPSIAPLAAIAARHNATLKCQYDAFAEYVAEAEREGGQEHPLYAWTKSTIEDPAKKAKFLKSFTLYVEGEQIYSKAQADAMEADLLQLVDTGLVTKVFKYDSNPANNPQPPARNPG